MAGFLSGIAGGAVVAVTIRAIDDFSSTFGSAEKGLFSLSGAAKIGVAAITAFGTATAAVGFSSLKVAADFEQTQIAFTTMLRSAEEAKKFLDELAQFAKQTPFTLKGVEDAARKLMAVGFAAEDVMPTLKNIGDVASGLGLGEEGLSRLILNLGQVQAQGKLTGRELRDFAVAGIPVLDALAKQLEITTEEVSEMVSDGEVTTEMVLNMFAGLSGAGGRFENLMSKQMDSVNGKFSNLVDTIELMQRELGAFLLPIVKEFADILLNEVVPSIKPLIPIIGEFLARSFKKVSEMIITLIPKFMELIQIILPVFEELIGASTEAIIELLPPLFDVGKEIISELTPAIKQLLPVFKDLLTNVIVPLIPKLGDIITKFLEMIPIILEDLIPGVLNLIESLEKITPVIDIVFGSIELLVEELKLLWDLFINIVKLIKLFSDLTPFGMMSKFLETEIYGIGKGTKKGSIINVNPLDSSISTPPTIYINIDKVQGTDPDDMTEALVRRIGPTIRL